MMNATKAKSDEPDAGEGDLARACDDPAVDPCDIACDAMPGLLCGDLPAVDEHWLLEHAEGCRYCANALTDYRRVGGALDHLNVFASIAPPPWPKVPLGPQASYGWIDSPVGPLFVATSDEGVCEIGFATNETESAFQGHLRARGFWPVPNQHAVDGIARQLDEYFRGERNRFEVPLDFSGVTPFTQAVLAATSEVPFGGLSTYRDIARHIGQPKASRAVGNALGRNPIPVIVPCHRIVSSGGGIGGYTGGIQIKERLLSIEGVTLS